MTRQRGKRTRRINDLKSEISGINFNIEQLQQNISQYKGKKQGLQNLIKEGEQARPLLYSRLEDEEQRAALRQD